MSSLVVTTPSGKLEGTQREGCTAFLGIPFAQPPVGPLRYRMPERFPSWTGVRPATEFGAEAPQNESRLTLVRRLLGGSGTQNEDCLYLNVWTPAADGEGRPVFVWIHGGGFTVGSGGSSLYEGDRLACRGDIVVVTINYRLGALGFLNVGELFGGDSGIVANAGLHDQIAALVWVKEHIAAFGGDPQRVTVFGESAGAMSVGTLLGTPSAQGLFQSAVLQSGASHNVSTPNEAVEVARVFAEELGPDGSSPSALRRAPVDALLRTQQAASMKLGVMLGILPWQPSVDGDLLPEAPFEAISSGRIRPVPTLIGTNRDEWRLFLLGDPGLSRLDEAALGRRLHRAFDAIGENLEGIAASATARYGPGLGSPIERWCAFQSDRIFHAPAALLAEACAKKGAPVYTYRFDWAPMAIGPYTGAFHALEIPFVFGTLRSGLLRGILGLTSGARSLSNRMQQAWIAFGREGRPQAPKLPEWTRYTADQPATMILGHHVGLHHDVHQGAVHFFRDLLTGGVGERSV